MADERCLIEEEALLAARPGILRRAPEGDLSRWESAFEKLLAVVREHPTLEGQLERYHRMATGGAEEHDGDLASMWGMCLSALGLDLPKRLPGH